MTRIVSSVLPAVIGLILIMGFNLCWRWHTIGPTPLDRIFPRSEIQVTETEPLDCDEAAYAYMGRRMIRGDVLYRDLSENKPPLGYWIYTVAVALGGANEFAIRVMPIPFVLATIGLVWWTGLQLGGRSTASIAALLFALGDTDPYVFGNGSNMEHFINFFSVASLALMVQHFHQPKWWMLLVAGVFLGFSALVKQVAILHGLVYVLFLIQPAYSLSLPSRLRNVGMLCLGVLIPCLICLAILLVQRSIYAAYDDIVRFAQALATDVPVDKNAPPKLVRWVTGNADPQGKLPWPFGSSTYLVWWGTGLWPLWLVSLPATIWLFVGRRSDRSRKLLGAWTLSGWLQILLPGLFWQHYYMLAVPGMALAIGLSLADTIQDLRARPISSVMVALAILAAIGWSIHIQLRDYWQPSPNEITTNCKGGKQWVDLREFGRAIAKRANVWNDPHLFVWGWQSPLFIYADLDGVTREFFANELLRTHADDNHPVVRPRVEAILEDLRARPPALILCGYPPFPALRRFLDERYLPSRLSQSAPDGRGLWVEQARYGAFETATVPVFK